MLLLLCQLILCYLESELYSKQQCVDAPPPRPTVEEPLLPTAKSTLQLLFGFRYHPGLILVCRIPMGVDRRAASLAVAGRTEPSLIRHYQIPQIR